MELLNENIINLFFDKVIIPEENLFACWEWIASKNKNGYGVTKRGLAHRISYLIWNKKLPDNFACHSCDNPSCVNPLHLWDGTNYENMRDMVKKGRAKKPTGIINPKCKLTEKQVLEIREKYEKNKEFEYKVELGREYNITHQNITMIINRKTWKHI